MCYWKLMIVCYERLVVVWVFENGCNLVYYCIDFNGKWIRYVFMIIIDIIFGFYV